MECNCHLVVYSKNLEGTGVYRKKDYGPLPCETGVNFLRQLNRNYIPIGEPLHKVVYEIEKGDAHYVCIDRETPLEAAAKIELFMEDPRFLH